MLIKYQNVKEMHYSSYTSNITVKIFIIPSSLEMKYSLFLLVVQLSSSSLHFKSCRRMMYGPLENRNSKARPSEFENRAHPPGIRNSLFLLSLFETSSDQYLWSIFVRLWARPVNEASVVEGSTSERNIRCWRLDHPPDTSGPYRTWIYIVEGSTTHLTHLDHIGREYTSPKA